MRRGKTILTAALIGALAPALPAFAGLIGAVGPFVGDHTETWESFANYLNTPGFFLQNPTDIMGGAATVTGSNMAVYQPGVAPFSLGFNNAQTNDGAKGMGVSAANATTNIIFDDGLNITSFGAYWGAGMASNVTVTFFDAAGVVIDATTFAYNEQATGGALEWHGWTSTTAIKRVRFRGDFVVTDGIQASGTPLPGPASLALFALATALSGGRRRRG